MYEHFTFYLFIIISKAQARSKNWWKKNKKWTIEESDRNKRKKKKKWDEKKNAQNDLIMCELATEKEKQKGERNYGRKY